jgi:hypothetical protein
MGILILFCILVPAGQATDPLWTVRASPGVELSTVVISHDGSTIVAGGDQLIVLSPNGTKLWSGWSGTVLDISRDGSYIATSRGQSVRLINRQGILLWDHPLGDVVTDLSLTPDAGMIAAGGGRNVQSWYNSGSGLGKNTTEAVNAVHISPAKDQIIVSTSKALRSFNLSYVPNWYDDTISPGLLGISGDGTGIVVANGNHIRLYHGSGTLLWDRQIPGGVVISLAFSRDGSTIAAGRDDGTVVVLDRNGTLLWTGKAGMWVTSVGISDDGTLIGTGSIDNRVYLFNREGTVLGVSPTKSPVKSNSVAVSGDGSFVVAVDLSNVYYFSRPGPSPAAPPAPESAGTVVSVAEPDTSTAISTLPKEGLPPQSGNISVQGSGTPASSGFLWIPVILSIIFVITLQEKRKTRP